jgi:glycosyltransferase involved in cell wall biosynthesis
MAAGVYPVVTDCPSNREWLGDRDGLLFRPDDAVALAAALARAIRQPTLWSAAAERNRDVVLRRADRDTNMAVLAEHYERLVGAARGPALRGRERQSSAALASAGRG